MRPQLLAPHRVIGALTLALALCFGGLTTPAQAQTAPARLRVRVDAHVLQATLTNFRPHRAARVRLYVDGRVVLKRATTGRRGRAVVRIKTLPRRPQTVRMTARVAGRRRAIRLRYTTDGTWVVMRKGDTTPIEPTSHDATTLPPVGVSPDGPFGPDPAFTPAGGVVVAPGQLTQALLDAHADGTRFTLAAGVHRLTTRLHPRARQQFLGQPGAVVDGSKPVTGFVQRNGLWVSSGHDHSYGTHGSCRSGYDACGLTEAVFVDGRPLWQVSSRDQLAAGRFVFDRSTDELILFDDPTGKHVSLTVAPAAFVGRRKDGSFASGVVVRNLVIRRFATLAQRGAVDAEGATGWIVERNAVVRNSGGGVVTDSGGVVRGNRVNDNGQLGVGGHGDNGLIEGNEIARNHTNGFNIGWEAGGAKWSHTRGMVVRGNYVHDNDGPGLWTDIDNITTRYENNLVINNSEAGIFHEISYDAVITGNTVARNGFGNPRWGYGAGIQVAASPNVTITGNIVNRNARGITLIQQNRGMGDYGPHEVNNAAVSGNTVIMATGFSGLVQDVGDSSFFTDRNNRFWGNTYRLDSTTARRFEWNNGTRTASEWASFHTADGPFTGL